MMGGAWSLAILELRQAARTRTLSLSVGLVLLVGIAALASGVERVRAERAVLAERETFLAQQAAALTRTHADDLGLLTYYLALPTEHAPTAFTVLASGLRDVHPVSQHLRLLGLVPQLYASELGSPLSQLTGTLDLAFVVTFLLPLLVIALGHDVASRDGVLGTDQLLLAQPMRRSRVIALRLGLHAMIAALTSLTLCALAVLLARLPLDARVLWLAALLLVYVAFWTLVVGLVATLDRSSGWNAVALTGIWLALTILLPAAANGALEPAPTERVVGLTLKQRELVNAGWDEPKSATMEPFWRGRPEWRDVKIPEDRFSWPWYYAMHEVGDAAVAHEVDAYRAMLESRERWTHWAAMALPPLVVQRALSRLAATDLPAHLAYRASVATYHEALKRFFYPLIFGGKRVSDLSLADVPRHRFATEPERPDELELASLGLLTLLLLWLGVRRHRRLDEPRAMGSAA